MMRSILTMMTGLLALTLCLPGCGDDTRDGASGWNLSDNNGGTNNGGGNNGSGNNGGGNNGGINNGGGANNGGTNNGGGGNNGGTNNGGGVPGVRFELVNDSDYDIFTGTAVGGSGYSCSTPSDWLNVMDSQGAHRLNDSCGVCNCGDEPCAVCDYDCAVPTMSALRVSPGDQRTFEWSGRFWDIDGEESCEAPSVPSEETLTARFCWGTSYGDPGTGTQTWQPTPPLPNTPHPTGVECQEVTFDRLEDSTVTVTITNDDVEPDTTFFTLENQSDATIYAGTGDIYCGGGSFVDIYASGQRIDMFQECGACYCRNTGTDSCGVFCSSPSCAPPGPQTFAIEPGQSRQIQWSGIDYRTATEDGEMCTQPVIPPQDPLHATFCWSNEVDDSSSGGAKLGDLTCETVEFSPGDTVVHAVGSTL